MPRFRAATISDLAGQRRELLAHAIAKVCARLRFGSQGCYRSAFSRAWDPDPSPETRFHKGRAKTGGRKRGTPNKPKSIKVAMREFTDENGGELLDWARWVFSTPDWSRSATR